MSLRGKRVLVVGLGKSGLSAAGMLTRLGAIVTLTDKKSASQFPSLRNHLSKHVKLLLGRRNFSVLPYDLIVVSPGVPWDFPPLAAARKRNIPVWPELELAWREAHPAATVAVTGTNGKTTTTALIGEILRGARWPVVVAGNIGTPLSSVLPKIKGNTILVLEVSSYQLEGLQTFHPQVGVFLNLTADHLARHRSMSRYARIKALMYQNSGPEDVAVLNRGDPWSRKISKHLKAKKIWFPSKELSRVVKKITLLGDHNKENAMAAAAAAFVLGVKKRSIQEAVGRFKGCQHRLQIVRTFNGVTYVNDSKSTNVHSTLVALRSFRRPIVLILGGEDKGTSYKPLVQPLRPWFRGLLTIGAAHSRIKKDLRRDFKVQRCRLMSRAVRVASRLAHPGDVVLLSPACASFDQYRDYEQRGKDFERLVKNIRS